MNFKLNPESIDYNIISMTESNFNLLSTKTSFLDIISSFFNIEDLSELKLATKLLELEDKTRNLNEKPISEKVTEDASPLVDVLLDLRSYYNKAESTYKFIDLMNLLKEDAKDEIVAVLQKSIEQYTTHNKNVSLEIYHDFDFLILKRQRIYHYQLQLKAQINYYRLHFTKFCL